MRTAIPPILPCSSARKPSLHPHPRAGACTPGQVHEPRGRCAHKCARGGVERTSMGTSTHKVGSLGRVAEWALGACTPVVTVKFYHFVLVTRLSCSSELAITSTMSTPTWGWEGPAVPTFLRISFLSDVNSLQDSVCTKTKGPRSPSTLPNFCFGLTGADRKGEREKDGSGGLLYCAV